ncbi:MAG: Lrp/AsnC ligand binding domain-containing protein [Candidatus Edwardsbacteria bacterium]|nr:Lrp/AsnC ligand binding domain-containing protein [Candidatus Edwardsbacteria bacterium]MBU1576764.1 Lrp/AsnC ligand binding domain-containing protein [Candidatus Edwardsbacteria bacterium]MBU2462486.1 Lrp/AsnC ligand binding domain-containing protein [Candidatus Edwardsbacteria bacterium]MBU2595203.1 Lrp/AsnC ligand binding domain-containing protein [Candidatus Edwardsbacteria bacterium]
MVAAYEFINCDAGKAELVVRALRKIKGLKQAHVVTGLHDIIAYVEAPSMKDLTKLIISKIQGTKGVGRTVTCIVVNGN